MRPPTRIAVLSALLSVAALAGSRLLDLSAQNAPLSPPRPPELVLNKGDRIAVVGNTLAERMGLHGNLETLLHARFPSHELVVRNLGFAADELTVRLRSAGFGSPDEWLARVRADVIVACFGYNESFAGPAGLEKFRKDLAATIKGMAGRNYNGKSPPRIVVLSPIAHENLRDPNLPDGTENNRNLKLYSEAMSQVARAEGALFVDLFTATQALYAQGGRPLTINGVHLNEHGDALVAAAIDRALFPGRPHPVRDAALLERIRQAVLDKNFYWFHRYRTVDGYNVHGGRSHVVYTESATKKQIANRPVMDREMEILEVKTANRDRRIWALARGGDLKVDDSNTPPIIPVLTNKPGGGPNGTHLFLGAEAAVKQMKLGKGLKVNLFASEEQFPELAKPVQMAFDTRGRLWVLAVPSYPHWHPNEPMDDKVLILEDTDGDGRADKCTTFARGLNMPTGLEFWKGGLFVGEAPFLRYFKDTDGDDKADFSERYLSHLDSADTHHAANSFTFDPGGALYFQEGTFHHTQVETPYGPPERLVNGGVFRYEPLTQKFEVYVSYGFANPHGHVFDRWGRDLVTDGTSAETYDGVTFSGRVYYPRKHPKPPKPYNQKTRPCPGTEILSSRHFPDEFQGNFLVGNVIGFQGILRYRIDEAGSGLAGTELEPIISSSDPNFRPSDLEIGPDGALYFTEWQNPIIGHLQHHIRDPSRDRVHGRIYRITHEGRTLLTPAKIAGEPIDKLLELLKEPEDRVRYRAKIELSDRRSDEVIAAVGRWLERLDPGDPNYEHHRLEALWVHQRHNAVNEKLLRAVLASPEPRARAAAVRVLCYQRDRVPEALALLRTAARDENPRVRLMAVWACSFFREAAAAEVALESLRRPGDDVSRFVLKETMTTLEPFWKPVVAAGKPLAADNPAGVDYLLAGVPTSDLIVMPRTAMVYAALLSRPGVVHQYRHEALQGLAKLNGTDTLIETFAAIERIDRDGAEQVLYDLAHLLTARQPAELLKARDRLERLAATARRPLTRQVAYAGLTTADGSIDKVWSAASRSLPALTDLVRAVPVIPDAKLRAAAYAKVRPLLDGVPAELIGAGAASGGINGRYVRIDLPGPKKTLSLAEVQVFAGGRNIAPSGKASQSSVAFGGDAKRAVDGNTGGVFVEGGITHTKENEKNPWWELDLGAEKRIEAVVVWNRTEAGGQFAKRLQGFSLTVMDGSRKATFTKAGNPAPAEKVRFEFGSDPAGDLRRACLDAVVSVPGKEVEAFAALADHIRKGQERAAAVRAIRRIPAGKWPADQVRPLVESLTAYVSAVPPAERTEPDALDALQLGKDLSLKIPGADGKKFRAALSELGINVVHVRTVPHKMIYDRTKIYAEAGKPVEIVLENADLMPHNLVIGAPGSLQELGGLSDAMQAQPDAVARGFIPRSPRLLQATRMVDPGQIDRLRFTAPRQTGEYPVLCTFPGHWRTMYAVLYVVPRLEDVPAEELNPPTTTEQHGPVRPFVRKWAVEDLSADLGKAVSGRNYEAGKALFNAGSCLQCHRMCDEGGMLGPNLAELPKKLVEKKLGADYVLREIIEPSRTMEEKFRPVVILKTDGTVVTGIVLGSDARSLRIRANPQADEMTVNLDEIDGRKLATVSIMPEGLLNTFTRDEILDLLAFVIAGGDPKHPAYKK